MARARIGRSRTGAGSGQDAPLAVRGRVCAGLFFFPRGGSAQVVRALARALPARGWKVTLASGSLGAAGDPTHAPSFFGGTEVATVDYTSAFGLVDPLAADVPFQPSYEDRPGVPDRVFAMVDDGAYERLVAAWMDALARSGAGEAKLLHLHHLTPVHEAALRAFPRVPIVCQLHGTELAFLRRLEIDEPPDWRYARAWKGRLRLWAQSCQSVIVPLGAEPEVSRLLTLERSRLHGLPSGVELERFRPRPLTGNARQAFWRRWLVEGPQGWDEHGTPGSIAYREGDLAAFGSEPVLLYLGRFTAVKRLPLLIRAHKLVQDRLRRDLPLVLVGGHPGEWEGEHPAETMRREGARNVFLAGWRPHEQLPEALNAADLLVLPSVAEAFGLALVEAMACGIPVIACNAYGPSEIVRPGETGWLVPPDDEQALAKALREAVAEPVERRRRGERAALDAAERFGWEAIATRMTAIYEQTVKGHSDEQP
jgi:glycosyltransferase involved in cell wall biosynthesis